MADSPTRLTLTRKQIAAFAGDHDTLVQIERLLQVASVITPDVIIILQRMVAGLPPGSDMTSAEAGEPGIPGSPGANGANGVAGVPGMVGQDGEDGIVGPIGATGPQGPAGASASGGEGTFQARLTGTSGSPTPNSATAVATLYLTPFMGETIYLYTSGVWTAYTLTEKSLSLASHIKGVCYDIFVYDSAGTVTLESLAWKKVTSSSSPTAGANKVLNLADTDTLTVGMEVSVKDGGNSEISRITVVVANTSITVDNLVNGYTTPDVYGYRARATALALQNNIYVKSGATDRRYAGTIRITSTTGQTEDSVANRDIWNYYNRVSRAMQAVDTTDSWNYSTATIRQSNGNTANQLNFVIGVDEDSVRAQAQGSSYTTGAVARERSTLIGLNSTTVATGIIGYVNEGVNGDVMQTNAFFEGYAGIGNSYLAWLERGSGTATQTWIGDGAVNYVQTGISGTVRA